MQYNRWNYLSNHARGRLTSEERKEGWHFCPDWDFLLIGPGFPELEGCCCEKDKETTDSSPVSSFQPEEI